MALYHGRLHSLMGICLLLIAFEGIHPLNFWLGLDSSRHVTLSALPLELVALNLVAFLDVASNDLFDFMNF